MSALSERLSYPYTYDIARWNGPSIHITIHIIDVRRFLVINYHFAGQPTDPLLDPHFPFWLTSDSPCIGDSALGACACPSDTISCAPPSAGNSLGCESTGDTDGCGLGDMCSTCAMESPMKGEN